MNARYYKTITSGPEADAVKSADRQRSVDCSIYVEER